MNNIRARTIRNSILEQSIMTDYIFFLMLEFQRRMNLFHATNVLSPVSRKCGQKTITTYPKRENSHFFSYRVNKCEVSSFIIKLSEGFDILDELYSCKAYFGYTQRLYHQIYQMITKVMICSKRDIVSNTHKLSYYFRELQTVLNSIAQAFDAKDAEDIQWSISDLEDCLDDFDTQLERNPTLCLFQPAKHTFLGPKVLPHFQKMDSTTPDVKTETAPPIYSFPKSPIHDLEPPFHLDDERCID
jgi:hypothetical protein